MSMASGRHAGGRQRVRQVEVALEAVDLGLLRRHLVARARVDQHRPRAAHQQAPHRHADPVALVGRRLLLPERLRHDAEHRAAVEVEEPVRDGDELDVAEANRFRQLRRRSRQGALLQLDEHALRARRVNERDDRALGARPGLFVDQPDVALRAGGREPCECRRPAA